MELVEELQVKTKEFLQPNPTARAKMAAVKGISKLSGQAKTNTYPQAEGLLGDAMLMYGKKLGEESIFGKCCKNEEKTRAYFIIFRSQKSTKSIAKRIIFLILLIFYVTKKIFKSGNETRKYKKHQHKPSSNLVTP